LAYGRRLKINGTKEKKRGKGGNKRFLGLLHP
jgi:hypothetical protein